MNKLILSLVKTQLPKLARNLIAVVGGWLATKGWTGDIASPADVVTGSALVLVSIGWSQFLALKNAGKIPAIFAALESETLAPLWQMVKDTGGVLIAVAARKLVQAVAGLLAAGEATTTEGLVTALLVYITSAVGGKPKA